MEGTLKYCHSTLRLPELPPECEAQVLEFTDVPAIEDVGAYATSALRNPIGAPSLAEWVRPGETVAILVSDATRLWVRTQEFLPAVLQELEGGGIRDADIRIIVASGTHRGATREEFEAILGEDVVARFHTSCHDCDDRQQLEYVGTTSRGTPVTVNRAALSADRIVLTGGVTFHFLAGFGGGPKAVLPGIASRESVQSNHAKSLLPERGAGLNPEVTSAVLSGNPIYEDMLEAAGLVGPTFLFNVVVNAEGRIAAMFSGDVAGAHRVAADFAFANFTVPFRERADLVLVSCGGFPKDINLYQAYKGLDSAMRLVKKGGTLVLYAECAEGIGNEEFEEMLTWNVGLAEKEDSLRERYTIARALGYVIAGWVDEARIVLLSSLDPDVVVRGGMVPVANVEELTRLLAEGGAFRSCCVLPIGAAVLPVETVVPYGQTVPSLISGSVAS